MKLNLFMSRSNQVIDDMGRGAVASGAAKPLTTGQTFDDRGRRVDATVTSLIMLAKIFRQWRLAMYCLRASMSGKLLRFFGILQFQIHHAVHRDAVEAFVFIIFKGLGLVVVIVGT